MSGKILKIICPMTKILISLPHHTYPVQIGIHTLKILPRYLQKLNPSQIVCISSPHILSLYRNTLRDIAPSLHFIKISDEEQSKQLSTVQGMIDELLKLSCDRYSLLLYLGGGVLGDITGFVASIYLRGIPYIAIPTTLLSQLDSAIGGKCGINLPQGKNLIGSFYHPKAVFCDVAFLNTLSPRDFSSGMAEAIKCAIIAGKKSKIWNLLHAHKDEILSKDPEILTQLISECIKIKKKYIECDERDHNQRHFLNLGHTLGHALETSSHYSLTHGEAVAQGIFYAAELSLRKKLCDQKTFEDTVTLLNLYGFSKMPLPSDILHFTRSDKKIKNNQLPWVLIKDVGHLVIRNVHSS